MKLQLIIPILLALALAACTVPMVPVASTDVSIVNLASDPASGATIASMSTSDKIYIQNSNGSETFRVSLYGYNLTNGTASENVLVNTTVTINVSTKPYSALLRITLNQSLSGTVTVYENASRRVLATISPGTTDSYVAVRTDGSLTRPNYIPNMCQNSSAISVRSFTALTTYIVCGSVANLTVTPWVSPDGTNWYSRTAISCRGNQTTDALTDITPQQMMYQICSNDNSTSTLMLALAGK